MGRDVRVERHLIGAVTPPPETMAVARLVDGDAVNPGAQRRLPAEPGNGAKHAEEDFLRQVERFVAVAEQIDRQLDDHPLVLGDEFGKRRLVAGRATLDERRFAAADLRPPDGARLLHGDHSIEFRPRLCAKVPHRGPKVRHDFAGVKR